MQVALVSDIHGNRQAFEAVLEDVARTRAQELWCLGDLVGYGADPDACVALAREHTDRCLAGNHDLAVAGALSLESFSTNAALAAHWTQGVIDPGHRAWLAGLRAQDDSGPLGLYHASPLDPVWEYVMSIAQAEDSLDVQRHRVCAVGHSHVALSFDRADADAEAVPAPRPGGSLVNLAEGEWLLNPGSVGQPRDGDPRAAWLLIDLDGEAAQWRRVGYDVQGAARAILATDLPPSLAERLSYGQ